MKAYKKGQWAFRNKVVSLGIESSCDDTAVALVDSEKNIVCNFIQTDLITTNRYGGVVPEISARSHLSNIFRLIELAFDNANFTFSDIDLVAATCGPGLIGGTIISSTVGKFASSILGVPFCAINHLEGHILSVRLFETLNFPFLCVLLTGGHTELLIAEGVGVYKKIGSTKDDAVGETFDKVARMLGMPYPGGVSIEAKALNGDPYKFLFPRPMIKQENCSFSFSGLKTAVLHKIMEIKELTEKDISDICASFQKAITDVLITKTKRAIFMYPNIKNIAVIGGVASNLYIRSRIKEELKEQKIFFPPKEFCTDNAAMIAWAGIEKLQRGTLSSTGFAPKVNWNISDYLY